MPVERITVSFLIDSMIIKMSMLEHKNVYVKGKEQKDS